MVAALLFFGVVVGSVIFHFLSPWRATPIASNWSTIDDTIQLTTLITGVGFVAVASFMAYCVYRFRHREGQRATYDPENKRLEQWLTVGTGVCVAAMLAPGLMVWAQYIRPPQDAAEIEVIGQQWQWSFRLPGKDDRLGRSDTRLTTPDNPLGVNPSDPSSRDDIVIVNDDLHVQAGKPVKLWLRSTDVVHDFYVPEIRAKMDLIPGMVTYFWFTPTRTGSFDILCVAFCGVGHPYMRSHIVVDNENDYHLWLSKQKTFEQTSSQASAEKGGPHG